MCLLAGASAGIIGPGATDQPGHGVSGGGATEGETEPGARDARSAGRQGSAGTSNTTVGHTGRLSTSTVTPCPPRQISELESEKQHLSEAVASLQERAQSNSEARVREVEVKNRLLHQSITDTGSRLASLETQLNVVSEEAERLRDRAGRCEEAEREVARLERSRDALNREVSNGSMSRDFHEFY